MKLPKTLYVRPEQDHDLNYFVSEPELEAHAVIGEKVKIGVYQLIEVVVLQTVVETSVVKS